MQHWPFTVVRGADNKPLMEGERAGGPSTSPAHSVPCLLHPAEIICERRAGQE
jgi:hypothetical protein